MTTNEQSSQMARPLIFGEVLFDCFPDSQVLGGAPFNVAWNLQGLGVQPLVITSVGDDDLGREVLRRAATWNIDSSGIQNSPFPTGRVDISTTNGEPTYAFWNNVAFDHIALDTQFLSQHKPAVLYHGSLALRAAQSLQTLMDLRRQLTCPVFVDINLRLPHYNFDLTERILRSVTHLKLNHEELQLLYDFVQPQFNQSGSSAREHVSDTWERRLLAAVQLQKQFGIQNIWLTAAEQGAAWLGPDGQFEVVPAPTVTNMVDTVGAGDALTAVIIHGLLNDREPVPTLRDAVQFAARVCQLRGATSPQPDFYYL